MDRIQRPVMQLCKSDIWSHRSESEKKLWEQGLALGSLHISAEWKQGQLGRQKTLLCDRKNLIQKYYWKHCECSWNRGEIRGSHGCKGKRMKAFLRVSQQNCLMWEQTRRVSCSYALKNLGIPKPQGNPPGMHLRFTVGKYSPSCDTQFEYHGKIEEEKLTSQNQMMRPSMQPLPDGKDTVPALHQQWGQREGDKTIPGKEMGSSAFPCLHISIA